MVCFIRVGSCFALLLWLESAHQRQGTSSFSQYMSHNAHNLHQCCCVITFTSYSLFSAGALSFYCYSNSLILLFQCSPSLQGRMHSSLCWAGQFS